MNEWVQLPNPVPLMDNSAQTNLSGPVLEAGESANHPPSDPLPGPATTTDTPDQPPMPQAPSQPTASWLAPASSQHAQWPPWSYWEAQPEHSTWQTSQWTSSSWYEPAQTWTGHEGSSWDNAPANSPSTHQGQDAPSSRPLHSNWNTSGRAWESWQAWEDWEDW